MCVCVCVLFSSSSSPSSSSSSFFLSFFLSVLSFFMLFCWIVVVHVAVIDASCAHFFVVDAFAFYFDEVRES